MSKGMHQFQESMQCPHPLPNSSAEWSCSVLAVRSLRNFPYGKKASRTRSHFRTALQSQAARCSPHDFSRSFLYSKKNPPIPGRAAVSASCSGIGGVFYSLFIGGCASLRWSGSSSSQPSAPQCSPADRRRSPCCCRPAPERAHIPPSRRSCAAQSPGP